MKCLPTFNLAFQCCGNSAVPLLKLQDISWFELHVGKIENGYNRYGQAVGIMLERKSDGYRGYYSSSKFYREATGEEFATRGLAFFEYENGPFLDWKEKAKDAFGIHHFHRLCATVAQQKIYDIGLLRENFLNLDPSYYRRIRF